MKFAIIAAGEGSRLRSEGFRVSKPLVEINGMPMLQRLVTIFAQFLPEEILVISNEQQPDVAALISQLSKDFPLRHLVKSTSSSMHSFYELAPFLTDAPFCLTTVDSVFGPAEFSDYISTFSASDVDGLMAVTRFVDDERPLYVDVDDDFTIRGFYDESCNVPFVSGGLYCLSPRVIPLLRRCIESGQSRMRNFQRRMVAEGFRLKAYPFRKIMDVDHVEDIAKANDFLNSLQ